MKQYEEALVGKRDYRDSGLFLATSAGISDDADTINKKLVQILIEEQLSELVRSAGFGYDVSIPDEQYNNEKTVIFSKLDEIRTECARLGWDGEGAEAISDAVIGYTKKFIDQIPDGLPLPEVQAEPDGDIDLEWYKDRNFVYSISINKNGQVHFAGKFGAERKVHGRDSIGETLQGDILSYIALFGN